jgi:hypothetical protein
MLSWPTKKRKERQANTLSWPVKKRKKEIGQHIELAGKKIYSKNIYEKRTADV